MTRWLLFAVFVVTAVLVSAGCRRPAAPPEPALPAPSEGAVDRYGGRTAVKREATGRFRVEQVGGRWLFITPDGHGYLTIGANHAGKVLDDPAQNGPLLERFAGDRDRAADAVLAELKAQGYTAGEAYPPLHPRFRDFPHVAHIHYPFPNQSQFDVFDPAVRTKLADHVREQARRGASPFCLGFAFADLPEWGTRRAAHYRGLPPNAPGRRRYVQFLQERYAADVARLNAAYGTRFESFDAVAHDKSTPATRPDDEAFLGVVADSLYGLLKGAVADGAPGHLFLGERFVLRSVPESVLTAVGKHVDVFCTQALILSKHRPPEWQTFQPDGYDREHELTGGKPVLVIDWATPFSTGEGIVSEHGRIRTEGDAADDAAAWLAAAFERPYLVGVFRCQAIGTHPNDRWFAGHPVTRTPLLPDGRSRPAFGGKLAAAHRAVLDRELSGR
ncbi:MAG: hypothetical protein K2X87_01870 [Gemmataceae bacterium]|nr:hypothetical protein [Gemmataceae bacterium]